MPFDDILCSWLVRSALVSLTILLIGSGAVLVWRQPVRRVRIIELVLAGCLIAPWLGMIPGYPQFSVVWWHTAARQEAPLPPSVVPRIEPTMMEPAMTKPAMMEPAIPEPMPLPTMDRATLAVPGTKTVEAPAHAVEIRPWLVGIYLAGVAIGAGWWLVGIAGLARLLWTSQPAPLRCRELLTEISGGRGDRVRLSVNRRLSQPFASSWGRALIVLPESLCGDEQTLRWCLAHEWAHVDGHDFRAWLLAGLAKVLFFYQPLLWWLRRQLRLCQDFVADSQAALQAAEVEDYAEFLTARAAGRLHPAVVGLSMGCRKSEIYKRVIMLLNNESLESRTPRLWMVSVTVATLVLVGVVAAVSLVPRAVADEKPAAKLADAQSPMGASKTELKPAPAQGLAEPNTDQARAIAEIEKLGGKVTRDEKSPGKPVISVDLRKTKVTDAGLMHLKGLPQLQSLVLDDTQITDAGLANLKGLTKLKSLFLSVTKVTDAGLIHLEGLTQLQALELGHTKVTDAGLGHLKGLTQLQMLELGGGGTHVTDTGLARLKAMIQLQSLYLVGTQVTDVGLENLKGLTKLWRLDLGFTKVTDAGLVHLKGLAQLQWLDLGQTKITDAGLAHLEGFTHLQLLVLNGTQVTDTGLTHLKGLTQLQTLYLWDTPITDSGLQHLKGLTRLRSLQLNKTKITDAGLVHLKGLTQLHDLDLDNTQVTDSGLRHLNGLLQLHSLNLTRTQVTDKGLKYLQGLVQLTSLGPGGTEFNDAGLEQIKGLSGLRTLDLTGTKITDAGLIYLEGLTQLKRLLLRETQVADAGLAHLKGLSRLQELVLFNTKVTNAGLVHLKGLAQLKTLFLGGTHGLRIDLLT